jgi:hypothetical protein
MMNVQPFRHEAAAALAAVLGVDAGNSSQSLPG